MRGISIACAAGATAIVMAMSAEQPLAHRESVAVGVEEIMRALRGKICTTRAGATFTFGADGRYGYDGLWKNGGRYVIGHGTLIVILDSGLERSFAISRHGNVFYMEETALYCRNAEPSFAS